MEPASSSLARDAQVELVQHEYAVAGGHAGQDQSPIAVGNAHLTDQQVQRDQNDSKGNHHRGQEYHQQQIASRIAQSCQRVGRHGVEEQLDNRSENRINKSIADKQEEGFLQEQRFIVFQCKAHGNKRRTADLRLGTEGCGQGPQHGIKCNDRDQQGRDIDQKSQFLLL